MQNEFLKVFTNQKNAFGLAISTITSNCNLNYCICYNLVYQYLLQIQTPLILLSSLHGLADANAVFQKSPFEASKISDLNYFLKLSTIQKH